MKNKKSIKKRLKKEYKECFDYLKSSRRFIYVIIGIFLFSALLGFFIPVSENIMNLILEFIREILEKTKDMGAFELIKFIFFNNLLSSFYGLFFGILFGVFPLIATIGNGYILGVVSSISVGQEGPWVLWRIFPHGIFELPAIFISFGLGLKLGSFIFEKNIEKSLKEFFIKSLKVFVLIVLPLLIIAAIIEGLLIAFL